MSKKKSLFVVALSNEIDTDKIGINISTLKDFVFTGKTEDRQLHIAYNVINNLFFTEINEKYDILFTGIGKINATFALTQYICRCNQKKYIVDKIYNIGTAGGAGNFVNIGDVILCNKHIQLDINATPQDTNEIGFTPYDGTPMILEADEKLSNDILNIINIIKNKNTNHLFTCATMDTFNINDTKYDIYDMEAYALAKTAYRFSIPFVSIKYITDNILENSIAKTDEFWKNNLQNAKNILTDIINNIISSF